MTDTFDALFAILMEHANKYDRLVFDALVSELNFYFTKALQSICSVIAATDEVVTIIPWSVSCFSVNLRYLQSACWRTKSITTLDLCWTPT